MMQAVVSYGTGQPAQSSLATVAGKTGTAELGPGIKSDAWFIGYAPAEAPRVVVRRADRPRRRRRDDRRADRPAGDRRRLAESLSHAGDRARHGGRAARRLAGAAGRDARRRRAALARARAGVLTNTTGGRAPTWPAPGRATWASSFPPERIVTAASAAADHLRREFAGRAVYAMVEGGVVGELDGVRLVEDPGERRRDPARRPRRRPGRTTRLNARLPVAAGRRAAGRHAAQPVVADRGRPVARRRACSSPGWSSRRG